MDTYVLMVQTDPDDKYITESSLSEINNEVPVKFLETLQDLDVFVTTEGYPALILVNDRGTKMKGTVMIRQLKENPLYAHIPIVVLGEISSDDYIREWYRAGASSFIIKPSTIEDTHKKISTFFDYWFNVTELSTRQESGTR